MISRLTITINMIFRKKWPLNAVQVLLEVGIKDLMDQGLYQTRPMHTFPYLCCYVF